CARGEDGYYLGYW
nr:immunoglobulin heavy chain junction region [Mus musculus]